MRKWLILFCILLTSCATKPFTGKVIEKRVVLEHTEITPPGYRVSCGITIEGKYECGLKFFITSESHYHPTEYYVTLSNGTCAVEVRTTGEEWKSAKRLDTMSANIPEDACPEGKKD